VLRRAAVARAVFTAGPTGVCRPRNAELLSTTREECLFQAAGTLQREINRLALRLEVIGFPDGVVEAATGVQTRCVHSRVRVRRGGL
jgi:hypothetical protein